MTVLMVAAGVFLIGVSMTLVGGRPAVGFLLLVTGTAVLVMARAAWRWMDGPTDPQRG